jgi:hypothetical protein
MGLDRGRWIHLIPQPLLMIRVTIMMVPGRSTLASRSHELMESGIGVVKMTSRAMPTWLGHCTSRCP